MSLPVAETVRFLRTLTLSQGEGVGERFPLWPWQERFVRGMLRPDVATVALSVARGAGKSTLLGALGVACIAGPLARRRGEVLVCAPTFGQSRQIFESAREFLRDLDGLPIARWRVQDSAQAGVIEDRETGARLRCLGADPRRLHGRVAWLVLLDEPAKLQDGQRDLVKSALETGLGKIPGSRMVALGTRPEGDDHWFSRWLGGEADHVACYAANPNDPPFRQRTWIKANPSLPYLPELMAKTRKLAQTAKREPAVLAEFRANRLNLGTPERVESVILSAETWRDAEGDAAADGPCFWGIDLGSSAAQSAVCGYWPRTGRLDAVAAFPAIPDLRERGLADGVGRRWLECAERGELVIAGQRTVSIEGLLREALERFGNPAGIAADRWRSAELKDNLEVARVPLAIFEERGQGYRDGSEDVRQFRRAFLENRVSPVVSLLMRSAMSEARLVGDAAANMKLSKGTEGGRRQNARDDAVAAALLAVALAERRRGRKPARRARHVIVA